MNPENRNMILAITLSMAVLFGWQMFVVGPELEKEAAMQQAIAEQEATACLLYTSPSPRDCDRSRMPSSA